MRKKQENCKIRSILRLYLGKNRGCHPALAPFTQAKAPQGQDSGLKCQCQFVFSSRKFLRAALSPRPCPHQARMSLLANLICVRDGRHRVII